MQAANVEPGYMEWFRTISHPYIYPQNVPPPPAPEPIPAPQPTGTSEDPRWMRVHEIGQRLLEGRLVIKPDTEGWELVQELIRLARLDRHSGQSYVRRKRSRTAA